MIRSPEALEYWGALMAVRIATSHKNNTIVTVKNVIMLHAFLLKFLSEKCTTLTMYLGLKQVSYN